MDFLLLPRRFRNSVPKRFLTTVGVFAVLVNPFRGAPAKDVIRISIASDSTAATWAPPHPERGWGQFLNAYFDENTVIANFAKPGASTKTFLSNGLWAKVIGSRANFVLIQFGHNDSHTAEHPEHTDAEGLYKDILYRFVKEARAVGAKPILITPVQRRTSPDTLLPYVAAMKKVAAETQTPLIDLHGLSGELYAQLGRTAQAQLGATSADTTHFSPAGAKRIAALVAEALGKAAPSIQAHLKVSPN